VQSKGGEPGASLEVQLLQRGGARQSASALLRLPSAALASALKQRLGSRLLSDQPNVSFLQPALKNSKESFK